MELCLPHSLARPDVMGPLKASKATNSASKSLSWQQQSPVSTDRIAAAHNAQMEATTAAMRADYDAKIAELMADLEGTRGEKEKTDTDLAILKASARKERLQWNKERTLLSRKVAEAEARAREASDGVASPEEFTTLQKALANGEATIRSLREALEVEETRRDKLQFEVACASTAEADVERLMVLVASLEKQLAEEREAKKCAEQEAEARSADARGLERRLKAAVEAAALAEHSAAKCIEDAGKITAEVHDARATQRHAELWLEKSLAEVDAVHALLAYERSVAAGAADTSMHVPHQFDRSMQTPLLQPPSPASDSADSHAAFAGMRPEMAEVVRDGRVGTGAQTPSPDSPTSMLAALAAAPSAGSIDGHAGGTTAAAVAGAVVAPVAAHTTPTSRGRSQGSRSGSQTPELDGTRPVLYSGTRLRTRMGGAGRGMGMDGDDEVPTTAAMRGGGGGGRGGVGVFSPPTPTVLFGELAGDGGSTTTTWEKACTLGLEGPPRHPANGNATSGAVVAHARILVDSGSGNSAYCHGSTLGLAKPGRAMAMTTTTTAKKNEEVGGGGGGGEENTMAALLSLLRLETSKREEVQARATELEGAIAVVAQEAAAAVRRAESLAPPAHHCQRKEEEEEEAARTSSAGGRGSELCPCLHVHGSGASTATAGGSAGGGGCGGWGRTRQPQAGVRGAAPQPENLSPPDPHATFVRLDQDRQVAKILGLVREARTKLEVAAGCGVSVNASEDRGRGGREKTQGKAARAGRGTSFPTDETEINSWNGLNPTIEVASLIEQLEGELKRSADDNAQLREFCTHLEGLLAAPGDRNDDGVAGAGAGGGRAGGGAGTTYGISAGAAVGGGCNGWGPSTAVGSNHPTGDGASPFAVRRGSFGERRKGAPLPGSFQDLC